ncbi:hypothetical protein TNCV_3907371 [Trichonephila clavipes]|nr:hypothetical protein TNCV_3907371 [Trichonephila clavipes]
MDTPKTSLKIDHETLNQRLKITIPNILKDKIKIAIYICGDSSHYAKDCEKRFKLKESNGHIHNRKNANTLKVESEKQKSDEFAQLQYVNIFVENQPVTALIDSGCQIPVLNSSLIRVNKPSEERITLSSCFGEQRMVEVSAINISLNQHSPGLSVRTAISPTLTEEFIIHPSVYAEIKKLGHAKRDVLLNENSPLVSMERKKGIRTAADSVQSGWPLRHATKSKPRNLRAQAQLSETVTETFGLIREQQRREERLTCASRRYRRQTYLLE